MPVSSEDVLLFVKTLNEISNYDFTDYSDKSITRRIEKVVSDNGLDIKSLIDRINKDSMFLEKIIRDITVNTTELFRDPKIWHILRYNILPKFKEKKSLSIWHAGCSAGQEVYSMLMLLNELDMFDKATVYGTDINTDIIEDAKKGVYKYRFNLDYLDNFNKIIRENPFNLDEYRDIPYSKYMNINKIQDKISILPFLTEKPEFSKHDLVKEDNIFNTKFDFIICRNVLIYFNTRLQDRIFEMFYNSLKEGAYLVIGLHESILGSISEKFIKNGTIYQKK